MYGLQELVESAIQEFLATGDTEENPSSLEEKISDMMPDLIYSTAESMLDTIRLDAASFLKAKRQEQRQFERRLQKLWGEPLDLLELFISLSTEAGSDFNFKIRNAEGPSINAVSEAITRLHAKACQVSSAILTLLRSGYADDAHARWRSLHEIAVVSCFIREQGRETAEQYLLHDTVQRYKLACQHRAYSERINDTPIPQEEFDSLELKRDDLIATFGKSFNRDFGWAASKINDPTLRAIEKQVGLDHMRPYYKMASDNEHPHAHGVYYRLGLGPRSNDVLLAGPSNAGLADPGHSTAISLNQVTTTLLATESSFDNVVVLRILARMANEIGQAFLRAHKKLETLADEIG